MKKFVCVCVTPSPALNFHHYIYICCNTYLELPRTAKLSSLACIYTEIFLCNKYMYTHIHIEYMIHDTYYVLQVYTMETRARV